MKLRRRFRLVLRWKLDWSFFTMTVATQESALQNKKSFGCAEVLRDILCRGKALDYT
ncbi:hypothetical protein D3C81_1120300 [compost metagenome]